MFLFRRLFDIIISNLHILLNCVFSVPVRSRTLCYWLSYVFCLSSSL